MKIPHIMGQLETAIRNRPNNTTGKWILCWKNGHVSAVTWPVNVVPELPIRRITQREIDNGFSEKEWADMFLRVVKILKGLKKI